MNKIVSCDILKEKLEQLVKKSKHQNKHALKEKEAKIAFCTKPIWNDVIKEKFTDLKVNNSSYWTDKKNIETLKLQAQTDIFLQISETTEINNVVEQSDKSIKKACEIKTEIIPTVTHLSKTTKPISNVRRCESWQGDNLKYIKSRQVYPQHVELQMAEIKFLNLGRNEEKISEVNKNDKRLLEEKEKLESNEKDINFTHHLYNGNDFRKEKQKTVIYAEIDRNDPKRISRRYIPRKQKLNLTQDNEQDTYERLNLLPPTQFRDTPPPPEAFRDPPESIDNILYYVMESVHENREVNRKLYEESPNSEKNNNNCEKK